MAIKFGSPEAAKIVEEMKSERVTFTMSKSEIRQALENVEFDIKNLYGMRLKKSSSNGADWRTCDAGLPDMAEDFLLICDMIEALPEIMGGKQIPALNRKN